MKYNILGFTSQIVTTEGVNEVIYNANGAKLERNITGKTYYYFEDAVYIKDNGQVYLEQLSTVEGRWIPAQRLKQYNKAGEEKGEAIFSRYEYNLTDHLGNLRVAIRCLEKENAALITDAYPLVATQENTYDPWGVIINSVVLSPNDIGFAETHSRYLYNSKEQYNIGWYDYGARYYDPAIGRWSSVDPLASKTGNLTPYNYAVNNPIVFVDIFGLYAEGADSWNFLNESEAKKKEEEKKSKELENFLKNPTDIIIYGRSHGKKKEIGRVRTKLEAEIDTDIQVSTNLPSIGLDGSVLDELLKLEPSAISIDIHGELAVRLGVQGTASFVYFLKGEDKGESALYAQLNGLVGIEGGGGFLATAYWQTRSKFNMSTLEGFETGVQGSFMGKGGSLFEGLAFEKSNTFPYFSQYSPYIGLSYNLTFLPGTPPIKGTPKVNFSALLGFSQRLWDSKTGWTK